MDPEIGHVSPDIAGVDMVGLTIEYTIIIKKVESAITQPFLVILPFLHFCKKNGICNSDPGNFQSEIGCNHR